MKYLRAPWRWAFISRSDKGSGCLFCEVQQKKDEEAMICWRGKNFFLMLNRYPYTSGHVMIAPKCHLRQPGDLPPADSTEMWSALQRALAVIGESFRPDGFNIGMNIGQAAGAGIADHFHLHVVPRWSGDANFMSLIGETRVVSYEMSDVFRKIKEGMASLSPAS